MLLQVWICSISQQWCGCLINICPIPQRNSWQNKHKNVISLTTYNKSSDWLGNFSIEKDDVYNNSTSQRQVRLLCKKPWIAYRCILHSNNLVQYLNCWRANRIAFSLQHIRGRYYYYFYVHYIFKWRSLVLLNVCCNSWSSVCLLIYLTTGSVSAGTCNRKISTGGDMNRFTSCANLSRTFYYTKGFW